MKDGFKQHFGVPVRCMLHVTVAAAFAPGFGTFPGDQKCSTFTISVSKPTTYFAIPFSFSTLSTSLLILPLLGYKESCLARPRFQRALHAYPTIPAKPS